jgi:hypothetical protein
MMKKLMSERKKSAEAHKRSKELEIKRRAEEKQRSLEEVT